MNIEAEFMQACRAVRQAHLNRLRDLGVMPATIAGYPARFGSMGFGVLDGTINQDGYFVPGCGPTHIVQPVSDNAKLIDMVAWRSAQPFHWGLRAGHGWALGAANLSNSDYWSNDVALHDSPLNWLRAGCDGLTIIDWDASEVDMLSCCEEVVAPTLLACVLYARLARPRQLPKIISMESRNAS